MDEKSVNKLIEEFQRQRNEDNNRFQSVLEAIQDQNRQANARANQANAVLEQILAEKEDAKIPMAPHPALLIQALGSTVSEYHYVPDTAETFEVWYARHESVFLSAKSLSEHEKVNFLLSRINGIDRDKYVNDILPEKTTSKSFEDTVQHLIKLFGRNESQFAVRQKCISGRGAVDKALAYDPYFRVRITKLAQSNFCYEILQWRISL